MKRVQNLCMALVLMAVALFGLAGASLADVRLVYVSGAPEAYPVEYYSEKTKGYEGYIPELLRAFGKAYGYEIQYLDRDHKDSRQADHAQAQADIISACLIDDGLPEEAWRGGAVVLKAEKEYRLLFTEATTKRLETELRQYCAGLPRGQSNAFWLRAASANPVSAPRWLLLLCAGISLIFAAVLFINVRMLQRRTEEAVSFEETDATTGAGNYQYLERRYAAEVKPAHRPLFAAVYFMAYTKSNTEHLDALLKYLALDLKGDIGAGDILGRVDDGILVVKDLSTIADVGVWTADVIGRQHFAAAGFVGGIYLLETQDRDLDAILLKARYSCVYAQKNSLSYALYSKRVEIVTKEEDELTEALKGAFIKDEFTIYLQFFVDAETRRLLGAEALSRWEHPTKGLLMPGKYITLLENENLIHKLDFTVMEKACECLQELHKAGKKDFFIACNFSRNTIIRPDYCDNVKQVLERFTFPRECLLLEVTEYAHVQDTDTFYQHIQTVHALGVKIVLDDFGAGLSDLWDLGRETFDAVKFDRMFVNGSYTKADDVIIKSLMDLTRQLNMVIICEGVENDEDAKRLMRLGCRVIQGFGFYLPLPRNEAMSIVFQQD